MRSGAGGWPARGTRRAAALAAAGILAACQPAAIELPAPVSPEPRSWTGPGLQAGFGRADITPPPGLGLQGYGPSGGTASGFRTRLYARAVVLEDSRGEKLALVATDLGHISTILHREVAARTLAVAIGADRLLLGATHSHSGPGHYFSDEAFNKYGAGRPGYDPAVVDFLARRIAAAVLEADSGLEPALLGWVQGEVWGLTRNRSLEAHALNASAEPRFEVPSGLSDEEKAIDPVWTLLRIDAIDADGDRKPAAAISIFGFHATGNPNVNDLYDGDVPALIERDLERYMDVAASRGERFAPGSVHLFFSGPAGDVSLAGLTRDSCASAVQLRGSRPAGPKLPRANDHWKDRMAVPGSPCVIEARRLVDRSGRDLARHARSLYDRAGQDMRPDVELGRAFRTYDLTGSDIPEDLCRTPELGRGAGGGAEDGASPLRDWRIFGVVDVETREGTRDPQSGDCQRPKKQHHWLLRLLVGPVRLPDSMQLMVVRIGDLLVGAVPGEPTAETGLRMREALLGAGAVDLGTQGAAVVGLANGYVQYVTTVEEYGAQHYEGGSTLYGPATGLALRRELAGLVATLPAGGDSHVTPLVARPGKPRQIVAVTRDGGEPEGAPPRIAATGCAGDTAFVRWYDAGPGALVPADGPILALHREYGPDALSTWDDDPAVEVRSLGARTGRGHLWEARWTPPGGGPGRYTVTFLRREERGSHAAWVCR